MPTGGVTTQIPLLLNLTVIGLAEQEALAEQQRLPRQVQADNQEWLGKEVVLEVVELFLSSAILLFLGQSYTIQVLDF
jgi:hypothetical protein